MPFASPFSQARAILRKNVILKMRLPQNTIFEIGMPLLYAMFLFLFSSIAQSIDEPAGYPTQSQSIYWGACDDGNSMSFVPNTTRGTEVMNRMFRLIASNETYLPPATFTPPPGCIEGYASYDDMRDALVRNDGALRDQTSAAVLLDLEDQSAAPQWSYTIMTSEYLGGFGFSTSDLKQYTRDYNGSDLNRRAAAASALAHAHSSAASERACFALCSASCACALLRRL
jgi:hypothetical protein